jgi:hypothetical protein
MNVEAGSGERGMPSTLDHFRPDEYSPYHFYSSEEWAKFRADTPLTLFILACRGVTAAFRAAQPLSQYG